MLAFAAAVIPIVGALYVAGAMLLDYAASAERARIYRRVDDWYRPEVKRLDSAGLAPGDYERLANELNARRLMLLEHNGVDPHLGTWRALDDARLPAPPRADDIRRQWILLVSSVIGVILLGIDASTAN